MLYNTKGHTTGHHVQHPYRGAHILEFYMRQKKQICHVLLLLTLLPATLLLAAFLVTRTGPPRGGNGEKKRIHSHPRYRPGNHVKIEYALDWPVRC